MQKLTHLRIRDANARTCLVTPPPTRTQPRGAHHVAVAEKRQQDKRVPKQNRKCGLRATPRGTRMGLRHHGIFRPNLRG